MEIMAATTNSLNQKELRFYAPNNEQQQQLAVNNTSLLATGVRTPFQREVREWQRIDPDTGALLTGRLEADRWINGPLNKYGKISDSQNIAQPNGTHQTQRKQLEVLQTCTATGGAMQVIRSQTVQTTSSRWSTSSASPLLLSASTSPIPQQQQLQPQTLKNNKHSFRQKTHTKRETVNTTKTNTNTSNTPSQPSLPNNATTLLTNGLHHKQHHQLNQLPQQYPHCVVNGISSRRGNRNWSDLTEKMSTLNICDNEHDHEHDHDSNYIVQQQSSDEEPAPNDNDNEHNNDNNDDLLIENNNEADHQHQHQHHNQYSLNKRNNLKNVNANKRHLLTVFANNDNNTTSTIQSNNHYETTHNHHNDHDSHLSHHHHQSNNQHNNRHNNNLSRDSSSGSCNNQLFLLDTAPSLKLSNLMKSSSSLSNSSNNSSTASQAATSATTNSASMNTHKNITTNKISLHAIVGNNNNTTAATTTTSSSTPSPTFSPRSSWQQPSFYRQNSYNNTINSNAHLTKSCVGDTNNCCSSSSSDESRSYAGKCETDLRHIQHRQSPNQQQQHQQNHFKPNDRLTPTHSPQTAYHRVDLESFRHYNNNDKTTTATATTKINNINDTDDDGLRLSSRHLRRQQVPYDTPVSCLQRSRSISTDDLTTDWDIQGADAEEPAEWRRVSKLRRSFQSTNKNNHSNNNSPALARRPLDLPTNSVSVSKIRAELENGRRLNTVMRNNHVDLAALSSILNGNEKETKSPVTAKRDSFLTAESLKEIRGKLKKLSDESLYKEDFIINQTNNNTNPIVEHLVNDQIKLKAHHDQSPERYRVTTKAEEVNSKHTTNSLESRLKYRDTNSIDWHLRRKSYGFEKMSPPEKAMLRMDASTDSGLERSGELQTWSPLTTEANTNNRTVVHFGETAKVSAKPSVQRRYRPQKSYEESAISPEEDITASKRHSIAVDESQYVRDNSRQTTQIHLNGFYEPINYKKFVQSAETSTDRSQQKRVEFSKTEVHFATESGRVNIVETDSKPPPTNNFRRRKSRSSSVGPLQSLVKSATTVLASSTVATPSFSVAMPVTLFGHDSLKNKTIASATLAYRTPLGDSPEPTESGTNVTVTVPSHHERFAYAESSRSSYASTSGVDTTDCDTDEMTSLRGILKNKPAKPKPYVLGENIDKPDELWGVQLKPVVTQTKTETVFKSESPPLLSHQKSVAERIQELGSAASTQTNNFSTKINVNNNFEKTGPTTANMLHKPTVQEILMHDLREHQKILDEGLKSTTLIIKTMRSATEFDEAMRRLSLASVEAAVVKPTVTLRSNSYQDSTQTVDCVQPYKGDLNSLYKSISFSSTSSWSSNAPSRKYSQDSRKTSTDSGASFTHRDFTPRLSFLDNDQLPIDQQLQRLRLIYDAAISQEEDSADEEVKSYFKEQNESDSGGGTQDSSSYEDDQSLEHSNSWSLLKARKTIWNIEKDKKVERSLTQALDKTELPKSNVMSIKLHSPLTGNEVQPPLKVVPPIAKPRTVSTMHETSMPNINIASIENQSSASNQTILPTKNSLKIIKEARGARQLREHEFSYFGIAASTSEDEKPKSKYITTSSFTNSPKRSLPFRRLKDHTSTALQAQQIENWQLENDKPDLLKHNAIEIKPTERLSLKQKAELDENEEHLYENIANDITPVFKVTASLPSEHYDRKMDLKRDAMILSEMNKNADQTLKELSDEAALKDRRRRSLQRRNSKPLETIDEKSIAERINDTCIAVKVSRGTYASEARKSSRHSTPSPSRVTDNSHERTSSQSSIECCPRSRSRSLSSEKEYDTTKPKPSRSAQMVKHKPQKHIKSRSSSLDSQRSANSQCSSGEDQKRTRNTGSFRREDRSRTKTKRCNSSASYNSRETKEKDDTTLRPTSQTQQQYHQRYNHQGDSKRLSSTTHSSSYRERVECKHDNASEPITTTRQQPRQHNSSNAGVQRSIKLSGSDRRYREDPRDSQRIKRSSTTASGRSTSERVNKNEATTSKQTISSIRDDERNKSQRSSSHRLERGDKEKDKSSRSTKGQSSRSTSQHRHERATNTENKSSKTKPAKSENTTSSKNVHDRSHHQHHQHQQLVTTLQELHERPDHKSKRDETHTEHVHGLKSAIIKTTTKLRDRSRNKKEKK